MSNIRLAIRSLIKTPFVTFVAILSLALGIGATSAIFSLFNQLLLRPLPVPEPTRLINLGAPGPKPGSNSCSQSGNCDRVFSFPMFRDLEKAQTVFTGIAAHRVVGANLAFSGQTLNGEALLVSGSYFPVLGLQPTLGRLIGPSDDRAPGESPVVVLSYTFWRDRFGTSPNVLDQSMIVNGAPMTIIGVAPAGFDSTTIGVKPKVFVPITLREPVNPYSKGFEDRRSYWAYLFARLKPGVSIDQARTSLNGQYHAIINDVEAALQKGMSDQTMARFRAKPVLVEPGSRGQWGGEADAKPSLMLLLGVTALVLLIACANIANLLLARSAARAGEMSVRVAIGAGRRHLVAQLLTESCTLAIFGGIGGLFVARWTLELISLLVPAAGGRPDSVAPRSNRVDLCRDGDDRYRTPLRAVSGDSQLAPRRGLGTEGSGRPAVGCPRCGALPRSPRHRADRAGDAAARFGRTLHQEPFQRQSGRPGFERQTT